MYESSLPRWGYRGLLLALTASLSGCSFLLDFEELKQGVSDAGTPNPSVSTPGSGGAGASSGAGGDDNGNGGDGTTSGNTGGSGAGGNVGTAGGGVGGSVPPACTTDCDDFDPCTDNVCTAGGCENPPIVCTASDSCLAATCVDGACVETPITGVVIDGLEGTIAADTIHRSTLVAGPDRFFASVYGVFDGANDLQIDAFDAVGTGSERTRSLAPGLANSMWEISSPAAMLYDVASERLNVFVAARRTDVPSTVGDLLRIRFDRLLDVASVEMPDGTSVPEPVFHSSTTPNYRMVSDRVGPAAEQVPGGEPFVVWPAELPDARVGLAFQSAETRLDVTNPGTNFVEVADPVSGLVAMYTDSSPAAAWMTDSAAGGIQVFAGTNAGTVPSTLTQCQPEATSKGYALHAGLTLNDVWTLAWSKQNAGVFSTENMLVQCSGAMCSGGACPVEEATDRVTPNASHVVVKAFADPNDANFIYQVILLAAVLTDSGSLNLVVNHINITTGEPATAVGTTTVALGTGTAFPDWPELAVIPPDKLGVTWTEPRAGGAGQQFRFARYRICSP